MKKIIALGIFLSAMLSAGAQELERGMFNHLGVYLGTGTEGFNFGLATPVGEFVELSAGMSYVPSYTFKDDYEVGLSAGGSLNTNVEGKVDFGRTTFDVKANIYPFAGSSSFFIAAGVSMGGKKLGKASAHSDIVSALFQADPNLKATLDFEDYDIEFDHNGDINADVRVNSVRPYLGLGFGRLVQKNRVGFRFELGAQYMGKVKFYQGSKELTKQVGGDDAFFEKYPIYPVLRLTLTGRIF